MLKFTPLEFETKIVELDKTNQTIKLKFTPLEFETKRARYDFRKSVC